MIIQCEQCRTKFRLDDSRVKDTGVKVRCAKCKHVFSVRKELPDTLPQPGFAALLDTAGFAEQVPPASPFATAPENAAAEAPEETAAALFAGIVPDKSDAAVDSAQFGQQEEKLPPSEMPASESGFSEESEWEQALKTDTTPFPGFDSDFASFDSAAAAPDTGKTGLPPAELSDSAEKFTFQTTDVEDEKTAPLPDFPDFTSGPSVSEVETAVPKAIEADTFSFEIIDSAPKPAAVQTHEQIPDQPAATRPVPVVPLEEQKPEAPPAPASAVNEELPPLSIASRRKQSPLVKILLVILILAAAAALYFQYGSSLLHLGTQQTAPEQEMITLRSIDAAFVKNATVGELLVISGEAVNNYTAPRTAIQVKGVVYGDNNQILISKNAFSGNILSKEQLATMPLDKIEATMANQLGSALDNLEVAAGKAVPFMIVISKLPEGAKNFGALPAGSAAVTKPK